MMLNPIVERLRREALEREAKLKGLVTRLHTAQDDCVQLQVALGALLAVVSYDGFEPWAEPEIWFASDTLAKIRRKMR